MIKSIILRMSQLKEMHRFVSLVEKRVDELEKEKIDPNWKSLDKNKQREVVIALLDNAYPKIEDVKNSFKIKYGCNMARANNAYKDAVKNEYLKEIPKKVGNFEMPKFVQVTTDGRKLTSTDFKIPTGRYNIWLGEHGYLVAFVGGTILAVSIGIATWVIKTIMSQSDKLPI